MDVKLLLSPAAGARCQPDHGDQQTAPGGSAAANAAAGRPMRSQRALFGTGGASVADEQQLQQAGEEAEVVLSQRVQGAAVALLSFNNFSSSSSVETFPLGDLLDPPPLDNNAAEDIENGPVASGSAIKRKKAVDNAAAAMTPSKRYRLVLADKPVSNNSNATVSSSPAKTPIKAPAKTTTPRKNSNAVKSLDESTLAWPEAPLESEDLAAFSASSSKYASPAKREYERNRLGIKVSRTLHQEFLALKPKELGWEVMIQLSIDYFRTSKGQDAIDRALNEKRSK